MIALHGPVEGQRFGGIRNAYVGLISEKIIEVLNVLSHDIEV